MTRSKILTLAALLCVPLMGACGARRSPVLVVPAVADPVPVSIEAEVYDPVTGFVWLDVGVRVAEADQEWSGATVVSPYLDWQYTDLDGLVFFDEFWLGDADVGFVEDTNGGALLLPERFEDEALVVLELDAQGFAPLFVEVPLSWDEPDVFVSVPFN